MSTSMMSTAANQPSERKTVDTSVIYRKSTLLMSNWVWCQAACWSSQAYYVNEKNAGENCLPVMLSLIQAYDQIISTAEKSVTEWSVIKYCLDTIMSLILLSASYIHLTINSISECMYRESVSLILQSLMMWCTQNSNYTRNWIIELIFA